MLSPALLTGLTASLAAGASLQKVTYPNPGATSNPPMNIYVPDNVVAKPPLVVVIHSCQSTGESYFRNSKIPWKQGSDKKGYITVWPTSPHSGTCWDVSSKASLTHNGGGDSHAIANMIQYAIDKYKIDPAKVFVTGGSSGGEFGGIVPGEIEGKTAPPGADCC